MRLLWTLMIACVVVFAASGCTSRTTATAAEGSATPVAPPTALPPVEAAPKQTMPAWIDSISPLGEAKDGAQIRVRFKNDLVPIEALESTDRTGVLSHFVLEPAVPGRFIILTPKMVGFEADVAIPHASRIKVTLTAGLADRSGNTLASDYSWSFTSTPLTISNLPGSDGTTVTGQNLTPTFAIETSDDVDVDSLVAHAHFVDAKDSSKTIAAQTPPSPAPNPSAVATDSSDASGPESSDTSTSYELMPAQPLALDTKYKLEISAGVASAAGNVPTDSAYKGTFQTYGPLTFDGAALDGGNGSRFAGGQPELSFSNSIDAKTTKGAITVSPAPNPNLPLFRVDGDSITFDSDALKPATTYTVKVAATVADEFGQALGKPVNATFSTGHLSAELWAPTGLSIFPSRPPLALNLSTTNLPEKGYHAAFAAIKPTDLIANDIGYDSGQRALLPKEDDWQLRPLAQPVDTEVAKTLPLSSLVSGAAGAFAYGFKARTYKNSDGTWVAPDFVGAVVLTDVGIFAQWFPDGGLVRTQRLSDGSAIAGAKVEIYESYSQDSSQHASPNESPCATGTTGADGTLVLDRAAFTPCASTATDPTQAPSLLVIAHDGADWSYARTGQYGEGYAYGLGNEGWSAGAPVALGTIVSDRTLYQPGEAAKFLAVAYFETDGTIARAHSSTFTVKATSPSNAVINLGTFTPDAYGAFTIPLAIAKNAEVGYWDINAKGSGGETIDGSYRVAEFKPPNFKVDLALDKDIVTPGTSVGSQSTSLYLFGAPVEGGTSHVAVTRQMTTFAPNGWDGFTFGREWFYPEEQPSLSSDVIQQDLPIDAKGNASLPIPVASDLPFAAQYTVSAQTTDVSHLAVSDTKTFVAVPSDELIGLRTDFIATQNSPFKVDTIVTDPHGKAVTDRNVRIVLSQRVYSSATQITEGSETPQESVHYVDVSSQEVTPKDTAQTVQFTAPKPGEYRLRANFDGATTDASATDSGIWVAGAGETAWYSQLDRGITVKLDKPSYRPGDTATALIESPFADADLYFAVIRHGVLYTTRQTVHGSAPQVRFTVTPQMLPNAAVEAVLVRRGAALANGEPPALKHLSGVGFATFEVALDAKYLKVALKPQAATLEPAGAQHVTVHVTGRDGKPVQGEVALAVVNDAILQLTGYRFPDLVKMVYADQPISTRFADNREDVKLQSEHQSVEKGFGFGGGVAAGPAGTRVRTKFVPLAYWNGSIHTDANGDATVAFSLPDDLTTWRVMALGLSSDARFGNGEATFITTKALVTNPVLPQFARPGDTFDAGVAVTNVLHGTGTLAVNGAVSGGATFASGDPAAAQTSAPAGSATEAYRFSTVAGAGSTATFTFATKLGDKSDAFAFSIPILNDDILENTVTTGTTKTTVNVPLNVATSLHGPLGALDVTVASTLLGDVSEPLDALKLEPYPFGTLLASRIGVASDGIVLGKQYGRTHDVAALTKAATADLAGLRALAIASDGGFADWPGAQRSDVYTTAFDVQQLLQARLAGFDVSADLAHANHFLKHVLANPVEDSGPCAGGDPQCVAEARLEVLETLGAEGDVETDFVGDIMKYQDQFSYYERVELARFLLRSPDWHARGISLRDELFQQVNLSARHATIDVRGAFGESDVSGQSQMLGLAIASGTKAEDVDRLLQTLLDYRHQGRWGCECDDAEAMNALVLYAAQNATPPNFIASVILPAMPPKTSQTKFVGYTTTLATTSLPIDQITRGPSNVALSMKGTGTLHYVVDLSYRVPDASPGIYQGLRIDRIVRAAGATDVVASFGLAAPAGPTKVAPGEVFDIEDRIVTDHPVDSVLITDPLPAGFEAVDQSFRTASPADLEGADTWSVDYQEIYRNRVISFSSHLEAGSYAVHYLVRSVTPGTYAWPGASAQLQYAPEEFGRSAVSQLVVTGS
jgi:uncharacterized protein YfaS (alpha-2-macroglobulin family)